MVRGEAQAAAQTTSYTPVQIAQIYGMPEADGTGQTVAIIELGGGFAQSDLDAYFGPLGLSPTVTAVGVDGAENQPGQDPDGADGEAIYQKRVPDRRPEWVESARVSFPSGRHADELCVTEIAAVAWAANLGTIVFHPWPSRRASRRAMRRAARQPVTVCSAVLLAGRAARRRRPRRHAGRSRGRPRRRGGRRA